jgi:RimJ/RimL family protein N-acetyltransferase
MSYLFAPDRHEADGFVLRSYDAGDGAALARSLNSTYDHLKAFMPWAQPETRERAAEQRVRYFRAKWLLAKDFVVCVASTDGTEILGGCGYHLREGGLETRNAEIGMWIHADAAGCGLGTRVLVELLTWGFSEWPWERLTWRCSSRNLASIRVAEKAGMQREGVLRAHREQEPGRGDTVLFAALRGEWERPPGR